MAIGILSQRPEKELGEGPDNLWRFKSGPFLVIECKNGSLSEQGISKAELGQLEQAKTWFHNRYGAAESGVPVIVHPLSQIGPRATAPNGLRVINSAKLAGLCKAFVNFVRAIAVEGVLANETKIKEALHAHRLAENLFLQAYSISL
jgi:hypothetical protein